MLIVCRLRSRQLPLLAAIALAATGCGRGGTAERIDALGGEVGDESGRPVSVFLDGMQVTDESLVGIDLEAMPTVKSVTLRRTAVTGGGLAPVSRWVQVEHLNLSDNQDIGDGGMRHLAALPELAWLSLAHTKVGDEGVEALAAAPALKLLILTETRVIDDGLRELNTAPALEHLVLTGTNVTDEGLKELAAAPALKQLLLLGTKVTEQGVEEFKNARPDCQVHWKSD